MVVGAPTIPAVMSKKAQAAAKRQAHATPLPSSRGVDPAVTAVAKKEEVVDDEQSGRPDKAAFDAEQAAAKVVIDALVASQNELRTRINAVSGKGPNGDRRATLKAELDAVRAQQAAISGGRGKTLDQVKLLQAGVAKKIADLTAAKAKLPFKSVAEVDAQIKNLDRQVESGLMKLVEEKKALNEIALLKKSRKNLDVFTAQQAAIDADKASIDKIRAEMDSPEAKALSEKYNTLRKELDSINKVSDESNKVRDTLFEQRNSVSKEIDILLSKKREAGAAFREANNKFYDKLNADRAKRMERQRAERQEYEDIKRGEVNGRLLEEANAPAFEREIEDCRTLIDSFQRRLGLPSSGTSTPNGGAFGGAAVLNLPGMAKLEPRVVESGAPPGTTALKKKYAEEDEYFVGGKKGKKGPRKVAEGSTTPVKTDAALNLPFGTLSALLALGIESPIVLSQVATTIESLQKKQKYFVENQDRVTKEKIAKVEKLIAAASAKSAAAEPAAAPAAEKAAPAAVIPEVTNGSAAAAEVEAPKEVAAVEEKEEGEITE